MLFSSISFLYYFLPLLLLVYYLVPYKGKNVVLLFASLFFYFYGEPIYIWVLLGSCFFNYLFGIWIDKGKRKKLILWISIGANLGMLCYFKYIDFFLSNVNNIFQTNLSLLHVVMPIGISFFTFQTMSYVIDVYRQEVSANYNFLDFATYVCLFPQLVAGPIVRYTTIHEELKNRKHSISLFSKGISRFTIGLSKKVLLANVIGELCTLLLGVSEGSVIGYWMIAIGYTLQIYFDFSGYSDMAIGLGNMFGFHFEENFDYPLWAKSITEFWRKWHISLSSWFRDYVYIPLGGNRVSNGKWIRNIFIVWILTGFWHGAAWNFALWGLFFAILLILEKKVWGSWLSKHPIFGHVYTIFLIIISFVIFNTETTTDIFVFIKRMFGFDGLPLLSKETFYYIRSYGVVLIIATIASTDFVCTEIKKLKAKKKIHNWIDSIEPLYYVGLLLLVTSFLIDASFNPFLYFRF